MLDGENQVEPAVHCLIPDVNPAARPVAATACLPFTTGLMPRTGMRPFRNLFGGRSTHSVTRRPSHSQVPQLSGVTLLAFAPNLVCGPSFSR